VATEIERKFLVNGSEWRQPDAVRFCQGYLSRDKERTVRVRLAGEQAFITIKGVTRGMSRAEFEYAIPVADAEQLLKLCHSPLINKLRHIVLHNGTRWEVDEFLDENAGLVVAEVELESEDQPFGHPGWLGQEVTDDPRYYNSNLASNPYCNWHEHGDM
jgi:CYTH domain-containing protein